MASNITSKLLATITSCSVFYQSTIATASIRIIDGDNSGNQGIPKLNYPSNPGVLAPHFPDSSGARPGASMHDLIVGGFEHSLPQPHTSSLPGPGQGRNYEDALIEAFFNGGGVATVCMERVRNQGVHGISSLAGVSSAVEEKLVDLAFRSRGGLANYSAENEISSQIGLEVPPPLKGKNACNGGYELQRCYDLLERSLSNRHQARYSGSFHPNLQLEWQELKRELNPFDPSLFIAQYSETPEEGEEPITQTIPHLTQDQADELILDLSLEIVSAIDLQAAYGDKEKVDRLKAFLGRVNPSAAMAIDCIFKNYDINSPSSNLADWRPADGENGKIVGPLSGAVYFSRDRNGELALAPLLFVVIVVKGSGGAAAGGTATAAGISMAQATLVAAIAGATITAVGYGIVSGRQMRNENEQRALDRQQMELDRELAREKMEREDAIAREKIALEREKMAHENAKNGNESNAKEAPVTEKSDAEREIEEGIQAGTDSVIKAVDDIQGWTSGQNQFLGDDYQLAALKSQIRLENGQSIEDAICPVVYEYAISQIEKNLNQESQIRVTQETSEQLLKERLAVIQFEEDSEWNTKTEDQLKQCSQVYLDERVR